MPPEESKQKNVRYLNIFENDEIDEFQIGDVPSTLGCHKSAWFSR